jgi:predicted RNase H-like HicB family nuclease
VHEEDGSYGISFPDFPGCVSGGRNLDEALTRGKETLAFHIAGIVEDGDPVPSPRSLGELKADPVFMKDSKSAAIVAVPVQLPGRAVRVNVSLDEGLLRSIDQAAQASGQSRSAFLADAARSRIRRTG